LSWIPQLGNSTYIIRIEYSCQQEKSGKGKRQGRGDDYLSNRGFGCIFEAHLTVMGKT